MCAAPPGVKPSILLRVGFTKLLPSPTILVRSYRTFSPLPARGGRFVFCGTVPAGHPGLLLATTVALWSPDFPPRPACPVYRVVPCAAIARPSRQGLTLAHGFSIEEVRIVDPSHYGAVFVAALVIDAHFSPGTIRTIREDFDDAQACQVQVQRAV